jgi:hypothetical protein
MRISMKAPPTAARVRELFDYDPLTGVLVRRVNVGRKFKAGSKVGSLETWGYMRTKVDEVDCQVHRLVWLHVHGEWPKGQIDHINGDKTDNRLANLREATAELNSQNQRKAMPGNRVGVLGVSPSDKTSGRWRARIKCGGRIVNLGNHPSPEAAHAAYIEAKRKLHAGCTL